MVSGQGGSGLAWFTKDTIISCAIVLAAIVFAVGLTSFAASGGGSCKSDPQYKKCLQQKGGNPKKCKPFWDKCMKKKCDAGWPKKLGNGSKGATCNKDPECQSHCTENATGKKGVVPPGCCSPLKGPEEKNSCPNRVNGQCVNSKPKAPKGGGGQPPQPPQGGDKKGGDDKGKGDEKSPPMPSIPLPPSPKDKDKQKDQGTPCSVDPNLKEGTPECELKKLAK